MDTTIETPRLCLIPFCNEFVTHQYVTWLNNPVVVRYSEQRHHQHTLESCQQYFNSFQNTPNQLWAIVHENQHIGNINAYIDASNAIADVGIIIGEQSCWSKGFGLEAWKALCQYLLKKTGVRKVTAGTLEVNIPMIRIMQKSGMQEDGRRKAHYLFEGKATDIVHYALFKDRTTK